MTQTADLLAVRFSQTGTGRAPNRAPSALTTYLAADSILLLIERALFGTGDVTAVLPGHEALLLADKPVLSMKFARLAAGDFAFAALLVDSCILVVEARIHLGAAGMILIPCSGVCESGRASDDAECEDDDGHARIIEGGEHWLLPFG
jgi:hypothetical protein